MGCWPAASPESWEIHLVPQAEKKPEALFSSCARFLTLQVVLSSSAVKQVVGSQVYLPHQSHKGGLGTISKGYHHKPVIARKEQGNNSAPAAAPEAGEVRMPMIMIIFLWQLHGTDPWPWLIAFPGNAWSSLGGSVLFCSWFFLISPDWDTKAKPGFSSQGALGWLTGRQT